MGRAALPTDDHEGTPEHGRQANRRDVQPNPINAGVGRPWNGHAYGLGGNTVFLTKAAVETPLQPCDDAADRRVLEHGGIKERPQPWRVKPPPQKTARAVRVHLLFTVLMVALATAYRLQAEPADLGNEPVGWQRGRRQRLDKSRDHVIVFARDGSGLLHRAESSLLLGVRLKDVPPGIGTRQDSLAKYRLAAHR